MGCEGAARRGLRPVARRAWALPGRRPTGNGRHRCAALSVSGFAPPTSGRGRLVIPPRANPEAMGRALADLARRAGPGGRTGLVLWAGRAGGPVAERRAVPATGAVPHRPGGTPARQPAEHLWPPVREGSANRGFDDRPGRTEALVARGQGRADHAEGVSGAVGVHGAVAA